MELWSFVMHFVYHSDHVAQCNLLTSIFQKLVGGTSIENLPEAAKAEEKFEHGEQGETDEAEEEELPPRKRLRLEKKMRNADFLFRRRKRDICAKMRQYETEYNTITRQNNNLQQQVVNIIDFAKVSSTPVLGQQSIVMLRQLHLYIYLQVNKKIMKVYNIEEEINACNAVIAKSKGISPSDTSTKTMAAQYKFWNRQQFYFYIVQLVFHHKYAFLK